jgi:TolA-binding protein
MEDTLRYTFTAVVALLTLTSSCSWYRDLERSLVEDDKKSEKKSKYVSREQYEQLLGKYEDLSKKYEQLKETPNQSSLVDELATSNVETVDVFSGPAPVPQEVPSDVESQLSLYRRAISLKASNPGEATKIFQQLENKAIPAIQSRARFQIGEILFSKQQFDLALQVFEDIIHKQAHSGVVLDALQFAMISSDKLGIKNKKDQYASMLNDVFETN